jgi:hypothetical protein
VRLGVWLVAHVAVVRSLFSRPYEDLGDACTSGSEHLLIDACAIADTRP